MITLQDLISSLPNRFKKEKAKQYSGIFHFNLSGEKGGQYSICIQNQTCTIKEGLIAEASCIVTGEGQDYIDLELGKLNPQMAIITGKIKVSSLPDMLQFTKFFTPYKVESATKKAALPSRKPTKGPLQGIRILDLTRLLPGPIATMLLADMGAEVIKIEDPNHPDYVRDFPPHINGVAANYLAWNRSKRSLSLEYLTEKGKKTFFKLVKTADVVIEQFRPGVMEAWGLGYEAVKKHNPTIVYLSITGYGQTGPYAQKAGHDLNYLGYSGILGLNVDEHGKPVIPGVQFADLVGGSYMAVSACTTALLSRQLTGRGQYVDVSMLDGVLPLLAYPMTQYQTNPTAVKQPFITGLGGGLANYNVYETEDNKWMVLGTLEPKFWNPFCDIIGQPDWKALILPQKAKQADLKGKLTALFKTKTQADWIKIGEQHDICLSPVLNISEVEQNEQVKARNMITTENHKQAGTLKNINTPFQFSETPCEPAWLAPNLGDDTEAILVELEKDK